MDSMRESELRLRFFQAILWKDWDPIGVNDAIYAVDEYDSYAQDLLALSYKSAEFTEQNVAEYLLKIETEHMSLDGNQEKARQVAKTLVEQMPYDKSSRVA